MDLGTKAVDVYYIGDFLVITMLNKSLIPLVLGPIIGYLVSTGAVTPACQDDVTKAFSIVIGGVITLGGLFIGVKHDHLLNQTNKTTAANITETKAVTANGESMRQVTSLSSFTQPQ